MLDRWRRIEKERAVMFFIGYLQVKQTKEPPSKSVVDFRDVET